MTSAVAAGPGRVAPAAAWTERLEARVITPAGVAPHYYAEHPLVSQVPRLLQMTGYDPGAACYRYHSAANTDPRGVSAFARFEHTNPVCDYRQWDIEDDRAAVETLGETADVILCHSDFSSLDALGMRPRRDDQMLMRMYHGSVSPRPELEKIMVKNAEDDRMGAVQLGARLYHQKFSERMHWVPIPMPTIDYLSLRTQHHTPLAKRTLLIGHSPTMRQIKGTTTLEFVVQALRNKGLDVALLMIEGKPHGEALAMKARCDIFFDSFFLGIQGSGLEAASMGQAVVAGDVDARDRYIAEIGYCPYTFADTPEALGEQLERLVVDEAYRHQEAIRVKEYTYEYHDYRAVGERLWRIVADERRARGFAS